MFGTFTDAIYLCYSTNVKKKCKGFQWHTVRNTGEIPIQHLAKMQMGVYIMELTEKKEFDLLLLFARNPNTALYRESIYERVWGGEFPYGSRAVDLLVQRLRKKVGWNRELKAVNKVGYRLEVPQ